MSADHQKAQAPLQICHIITRMIVGGAQENTLLTVRGLMEKGHGVTLVTGPTRGSEGNLLVRNPLPGLQRVEVPELVRELSPWRDWRAYRELRRHLAMRSYDVVHTHSSKAGILGRLAAHRCAVPAVLHTVHGQAFHRYERWWRNQLYIMSERCAARASDRILAVAQAMVDQCVRARVAPREKYAVVYSGMEMGAFLSVDPDPDLRRQLGIPLHAPVIGKIARLFELKGHDYLLEAAGNVVQRVPDTRFLLVGDGPLRPRLEADVRKRGLENNVVFAGLISPDDIPRYTAIMDILVHLSLREGLPRTVVQALASGIPAVGFDLDGTPEVILENRTGHLCPAGDVDCVTNALLDLLQAPEKAAELGRAGREFVRDRFDWRRMVDSIEQHYYDVLKMKSALTGVR